MIFIYLITGCAPYVMPTGDPPAVIVKENLEKAENHNRPVEEETIKTPEASDDEKITYNEYTVKLDIDPYSRSVHCIEKVKFKNNSGVKLDKIYFNVYLNAFRENSEYVPFFENYRNTVFKYGEDYSIVEFISVLVDNEETSYSFDDITLCINLKEALLPGSSTNITLSFNSYIPKICHRTGANNNAMWFGNFIPTLAVFDDQGWRIGKYYPAGDPFYSQIGNYSVTIQTPKDYTVVSTAQGVESEVDDKKTTTITANMVRDFAFAISKNYLTNSIVTDTGTTINFYHYSNISNINEFMKIAKESVEYYSARIGSYPYPVLNIVESELFFQGGMEYPQFILMDSTYLSKRRAIDSLTHEIGHQWFYNIIGNDQITSSWLDEGLTTFIQQSILYTDEETDASMAESYSRINRIFKSKASKNGDNAGTTLATTLDTFQTWQEYYDVHYSRGKLLIYSLYKKMGKEKFDQFLKKYYSKYSFKEVKVTDFIETAEDIFGSELTEFFNAWILDTELPDLGGLSSY